MGRKEERYKSVLVLAGIKRMEGGGCEVWLTRKKNGEENNRLCRDLILLQGKYKSHIEALKGPQCPLLRGNKAGHPGGFSTWLSGDPAFLTIESSSSPEAGFCQCW